MAAWLVVSRPMVWHWQQRFAEEGADGPLRDKTRKPGKAPIDADTVARVVALTCAEPPHEATHWTGRAMAQAVGMSLAGPTLGAIETASLAIGAIGQGLVLARGRLTKHAIKQVDRMLSNRGIDLDIVLRRLISFVIGACERIGVVMPIAPNCSSGGTDPADRLTKITDGRRRGLVQS